MIGALAPVQRATLCRAMHGCRVIGRICQVQGEPQQAMNIAGCSVSIDPEAGANNSLAKHEISANACDNFLMTIQKFERSPGLKRERRLENSRPGLCPEGQEKSEMQCQPALTTVIAISTTYHAIIAPVTQMPPDRGDCK